MTTLIICTYNRERFLPGLFDSIVLNDYSKTPYEIVVIDNNSNDRTAEICRQFAADHPDVDFRYFFESEQGLSNARNRGLREARGEVVIFVDDDALIDADYISSYINYLDQHPDVMAAGGPIEPLYESSEPSWMSPYTKSLLCGWLNFGKEVREFPAGKYPGGGNAAYRKSVFDAVGLFNPKLGRNGNSLGGAEEKDIFDKMQTQGMRYMYLPDPVLHHIIPQYKLEEDYFNRLTFQIGQSERQRTLAISKIKFCKRLLMEGIKWGGTLVLFCLYSLQRNVLKGWKLILFRLNVTKGLFTTVK